MSSILAMYSSLSSGTDHIFFPPRLEVVAEEKNTDGFSPHLWHQFAFDRFFGDQPHGPPRPAFRRIATDHGNNPLTLFGISRLCAPGRCLSYKSALQPGFLVAPSDFPDRF